MTAGITCRAVGLPVQLVVKIGLAILARAAIAAVAAEVLPILLK